MKSGTCGAFKKKKKKVLKEAPPQKDKRATPHFVCHSQTVKWEAWSFEFPQEEKPAEHLECTSQSPSDKKDLRRLMRFNC